MSYWRKIGAIALALGAVAALAHSMDSGRSLRAVANNPKVFLGESEELDLECVSTDQRVMAGCSLVASLAEGKTSLDEVVHEFIKLHENQPVFEIQYQEIHPGRTVEERVARDLANRAYLHLEQPAKQAQLAQGLTIQFSELFPGSKPLQLGMDATTQAPVNPATPIPLPHREGRKFSKPLPRIPMG